MNQDASTNSPASDELLWQQACLGQEDAFTQLMQRNVSRLISYGRKWSRDEELIKDSVQDVLSELWLHRPRVINSVRAYLLASVRNRVIKMAQHSLRYGQTFNPEHESSFTITYSVEDQLIEEEEQRHRVVRLNAYINRLPARQQEVIYLKFYQNLTQGQIAEVMGINYQSVSNLLQRTLTALRTEFSSELLSLLGLLSYCV